ncbi:gliding motility-associated C-terminal domain-containing protein [Dyadobacter sp. 676]|uniref:Gliding motility-associated C-terminal domain-containing protein n=1 Tax=Dyadobacter sp. 676 TaxID=3088362 RepID=A0AAU8FEV9_9BACT
MMKLFLIATLLCCCTKAFSKSIVGSHLEWQAISIEQGEYKVTLRLYLDETSGELDQQKQYVYLIQNDEHWKREGVWKYFGLFYLNLKSSGKIEQAPLPCRGVGQRDVFLNIYESVIKVPELAQLPSINGFVVAWRSQIGQRDGGDKNFVNSSLAYEWVTVTIPPITEAGTSIRNWSPVIDHINTFAICKGELVTIPLPASDHDGDNLKYNLSKPYGIHNMRFGLLTDSIYVSGFVWASGYTDQHQMHGNPALTINENTGEITVKPSEEGQYFIGISVDEYRNGQKIGSVSFYYTLTVVDCNEQQVWDKEIYKDTTSVRLVTICEGSQATLTSKQTFPGPQPEFQWTKNGKTIWGANAQSITISEEGEYQLLVKKINGCPNSFESETVNVSIISSSAEMDSIPPICDTTLPIALNATPPGGTFTGTGVTGSMFDPAIAGEGTHEIQYAIQGSEACPTAVARRKVFISLAPELDLEDILYTSRDKPIHIGVKDSLDVAYRWTPPMYLNSDAYADPLSTPSAGITYTVTATNAYGCTTSREVKIKIVESIFIPDAFTPNGDGVNETWELKGIEAYPNCHVTIYNRWGEVIFHSMGYQNAFDGTVGGALQMSGVYAYKIRLTENSPDLTGSLTIIR